MLILAFKEYEEYDIDQVILELNFIKNKYKKVSFFGNYETEIVEVFPVENEKDEE